MRRRQPCQPRLLLSLATTGLETIGRRGFRGAGRWWCVWGERKVDWASSINSVGTNKRLLLCPTAPLCSGISFADFPNLLSPTMILHYLKCADCTTLQWHRTGSCYLELLFPQKKIAYHHISTLVKDATAKNNTRLDLFSASSSIDLYKISDALTNDTLKTTCSEIVKQVQQQCPKLNVPRYGALDLGLCYFLCVQKRHVYSPR